MNEPESIQKVCVMASFPARKASMLKVISQLSPQCDIFCLWLNEYTSIPEELSKFKNLDIRLSGEDDIKDAGKFAFLDKYQNCYYLTVDDDINYPENYVKSICRNIDRYGRHCIVSYHGHVRLADGTHLYSSFAGSLLRDMLANIRLGTGVAGCVPACIGLKPLTMVELHFIDTDLSLGIWASNNGVPMVICGHRKGWLSNIELDGVKYDGIQRLTGSQALKTKRQLVAKQRKKLRQILDPEFEAKVLERAMSILP